VRAPVLDSSASKIESAPVNLRVSRLRNANKSCVGAFRVSRQRVPHVYIGVAFFGVGLMADRLSLVLVSAFFLVFTFGER